MKDYKHLFTLPYAVEDGTAMVFWDDPGTQATGMWKVLLLMGGDLPENQVREMLLEQPGFSRNFEKEGCKAKLIEIPTSACPGMASLWITAFSRYRHYFATPLVLDEYYTKVSEWSWPANVDDKAAFGSFASHVAAVGKEMFDL